MTMTSQIADKRSVLSEWFILWGSKMCLRFRANWRWWMILIFKKSSMDILAMSAEAALMNQSPLASELSLGILRHKWILKLSLSLSYSTCSCAPVTSQVCLSEGSDYNFIPVFLKPVLFSAPAVQCGVLYCPRPRQGDMLGLLSQCLALTKWTCNIVWGR